MIQESKRAWLVILVITLATGCVVALAVLLFTQPTKIDVQIGDEVETQIDYSASSKELISRFPKLTQVELDRRFYRDQILLNNFIFENNLSAEEVLAYLGELNQAIVDEVAKDLDITEEEARYLLLQLNEYLRNYPTLPLDDAYTMLVLDMMTFEEKIENDVEIPHSFSGQKPSPSRQVSLVSDASSSQSFLELVEKQTGGKIDASELVDFDVAELMLNEIDHNAGYTIDDLEQEFCLLGLEKSIVMNLEPVNSMDWVNYSYGQIIYGPNGVIVPELSRANKGVGFRDESDLAPILLVDLVRIPLTFDEGTYVIEYLFNDYSQSITRIVRTSLNCRRQLIIENFHLLAEGAQDVKIKEDSGYSGGDIAVLAFDLGGFGRDLLGEEVQFEIELVFLNADNTIVSSLPPFTVGGFTMNRNELLEIVTGFQVPEFLPGEYTLLFKVRDVDEGMAIRSRQFLEVLE
jgi:hypothetical protein